MRYYILILLCISALVLDAIAMPHSILTNDVYHASYSETRCVTAYYDPTNLGTNLTHLTLWDISDPINPIRGTTIYNYDWIGYRAYQQPTIYGNLLFYIAENRLYIVNINDVYAPVQLCYLLVPQTYCFTILDHYILLGNQDGTIQIYDLSIPTNPSLVNTITALPAIWDMWITGDLLAVKCGNYSTNTAKLYRFSPALVTLVEEATVTTNGKLSYVGKMNGFLVTQDEYANIMMYESSLQPNPALICQIAANPDMHQIMVCEDTMVSISTSNCIKIWQMDANNTLYHTGQYDLSHLNLSQGVIFDFEADRVVYSVGNLICLFLDVSDLSPNADWINSFSDGTDFRNLAIPAPSNSVYYPDGDRLSSVVLDNNDLLSNGLQVTNAGNPLKLMEHSDKLHTITEVDSSIRLRSISLSNPENPTIIADINLLSGNILTIKGPNLYTGSEANIKKYTINANGIPVWQKNLSYNIPVYGYDVYFWDVCSWDGFDYGVGVFGHPFIGYYPVFVYWTPNENAEYLMLNDFLQRINVVNDYLLLSGYGIHSYRLIEGIPQLENVHFHNNFYRGITSSHIIDNRFLLECYEVSNRICMFDLINPANPSLIQTIQQENSSFSLRTLNNRLLAANGSNGIQVYQLNLDTDIQEQHSLIIPDISAFPNPFSESVNLGFSLKKASPVKLQFYNIKGQRVLSKDISNAKAGTNSILWDGCDDKGKKCPAGVYLVRINSLEGVTSRKVTKM